MRKSELKRHTPMKRGKQLKAKPWKQKARKHSTRKPMKRSNAKRKAKLFARNFHSPAFVRMVKYRGHCQTCGHVAREEAPCECSHAEPRGMGGCGADWTRIFRQCPKCHDGFEGKADRFLAEHGLTWDHIEGFIAAIQGEWHDNKRG